MKRDKANVIDVVDDKILHGQAMFNMEKFTSLKAKHPGHPPHLPGPTAGDMHMFQNARPNNLLQQPPTMYMNGSYNQSVHNNMHSPNPSLPVYSGGNNNNNLPANNRLQSFDFGMGGQPGLQPNHGYLNSPSADDHLTRSLLSDDFQEVINLLIGR